MAVIAREWWRFAARCVGRLNRRRSWTEFYATFRKRRAHLELYKRRAHATGVPWLDALGADERARLEEIEGDRTISVSGRMHWRTVANAQAGKEREKFRTTGTASGRISLAGTSTPSKGRSSVSIKSSFTTS